MLFAVAGGLVSLVLLTAYYAISGYSLEWTLELHKPGGKIYYCLGISLLGAGILLGWRRGVQVTAAGTGIALLAVPLVIPPSFPAYLTELNTTFTVFMALFLVGAMVEYAIRNPSVVGGVFTPAAVHAGLFAGVFHVVCVFAVDSWFGPAAYFQNLGNVAVTAWMLAGALLVGATTGVLLVRYRLATPLLFVMVAFTGTTYLTWDYYRELGNTASAAAFTAFSLYQVAWLLVLGFVIAIGVIEYLLRDRSRRQRVGT
jgi:hypothetical protein